MQIDYPQEGQIPGLRQLWKAVFGDDDRFLDAFFAAGFAPRRCRCVTEQGRICGAVYWFDCTWQDRNVAYLYALATAQDLRGQGLAHKLMADVHSLLQAQGYAGTVLVPGAKPLFEFYADMGYTPVNCAKKLRVTPGKPIGVRKIGPEEYGRLRRCFLGQKDVILVPEHLDFVSRVWDFYAGNRWVLAALDSGKGLAGMELLGDASAAPGILAALGKEKGSFRVPGKGAFAMYKPLTNPEIPDYFGLAMD